MTGINKYLITVDPFHLTGRAWDRALADCIDFCYCAKQRGVKIWYGDRDGDKQYLRICPAEGQPTAVECFDLPANRESLKRHVRHEAEVGILEGKPVCEARLSARMFGVWTGAGAFDEVILMCIDRLCRLPRVRILHASVAPRPTGSQELDAVALTYH